MNNLWSISLIFESHQVVSIQTGVAMFSVLVKEILHNVDSTEVSVMAFFRE